MKDPNKVLIPSGNLVFVTLREEESGESTPFTPLDDLPLNLGHGPVIETSVNGLRSLGMRIADLAYVVRSPIASRTASVSSSNRFPFNLR